MQKRRQPKKIHTFCQLTYSKLSAYEIGKNCQSFINREYTSVACFFASVSWFREMSFRASFSTDVTLVDVMRDKEKSVKSMQTTPTLKATNFWLCCKNLILDENVSD